MSGCAVGSCSSSNSRMTEGKWLSTQRMPDQASTAMTMSSTGAGWRTMARGDRTAPTIAIPAKPVAAAAATRPAPRPMSPCMNEPDRTSATPYGEEADRRHVPRCPDHVPRRPGAAERARWQPRRGQPSDHEDFALDAVDGSGQERQGSGDEQLRVHAAPSATRAILASRSCRSHPLKALMSNQ